ncbi:MAG: SDR family oxidoreductase [Candidatus Saccharibacteria bacterium]
MLKDKIVFVNAGITAIGRALALILAREGAVVCLNNVGSDSLLVKQLQAMEADYLLVNGDLASLENCQTMLRVINNEYGRLDVIINIISAVGSMTVKEEAWHNKVEFLKAFYYGTAMLRTARNLRVNRLINVVIPPFPSRIDGIENKLYRVSVDVATKAAARDYITESITVNSVISGLMRHPDYDPASIESGRLPLAVRLGHPEEIAEITAFLASDKTAYMTGQVIEVDGGLSVAGIGQVN